METMLFVSHTLLNTILQLYICSFFFFFCSEICSPSDENTIHLLYSSRHSPVILLKLVTCKIRFLGVTIDSNTSQTELSGRTLKSAVKRDTPLLPHWLGLIPSKSSHWFI